MHNFPSNCWLLFPCFVFPRIIILAVDASKMHGYFQVIIAKLHEINGQSKYAICVFACMCSVHCAHCTRHGTLMMSDERVQYIFNRHVGIDKLNLISIYECGFVCLCVILSVLQRIYNQIQLFHPSSIFNSSICSGTYTAHLDTHTYACTLLLSIFSHSILLCQFFHIWNVGGSWNFTSIIIRIRLIEQNGHYEDEHYSLFNSKCTAYP